MAGEQARPVVYPGGLSADEVRRRTFKTSFRGFDPGQVQAFLEAVASELLRLVAREAELIREVGLARQQAATPHLDEEALTEALGHEAAQILHSAHEAGADVRKKADENAARVLRDAHQQAESVRHDAESLLSERTAEADRAAEAVRAAAHAEATAVVARARQEAEAALVDARARFDAMSEEAEAFKNRMLGELGRRRRVMLAQVEQLSAGRDSMLRAVADVRLLIDQVTGSLEGIESDAKAAADIALDQARRRAELDTPSLAELAPSELGAAALGELPPTPEVLRISSGPLSAVAAKPAEPTGAAPLEAGATVTPAEEAPDRNGAPSAAAAPEADAPIAPHAALAAPEPDPVAARAVGAGPREPAEPERRLYPLRILRRNRSEEENRRETGPLDLDEGVRIIPPEPDTPVTELEAPERTEADAGPDATDGASTPPAEPVVQVAGSHESAAAAALTEAPPNDPSDQPGETVSVEAEDHPSVDQLFARLRADRAVAVDAAEEALAEAGLWNAGPRQPVEVAPESNGSTSLPDGNPAVEPVVAAESEPASEPGRPSEDELLRQRDSLLAMVQDRLARKLKRTLQDDQNELLDRVRNSVRHPSRPILMPEPEQLQRFQLAALPLLVEAFASGCQFAVFHVSGSAAAPSAPVGARATALATDLVGQLRPRLDDALADRGLDEAGMADGVGSVYRAWKGERVEGLAADHLIGAFQAGVLASVPDQARLRWVANDEGGPCPDCDDNVLAGPTAAGREYPTGQAHPPAHPGCRCLLVPDLT